MKLYTKIES